MESDGNALLGELERLSALYEKQLLTDAEFALAKQKLLSSGSTSGNTGEGDEVYEYHTVTASTVRGGVHYWPQSGQLD